MEDNQDLLRQDELVIDNTAYDYLRESGKWSRFLGIMGFIASALIAVLAGFASFRVSELSSMYSSNGVIGGGMVLFIYLVVAVISFFMALFLYRFGTKVKDAFDNTDQELLNIALLNLKNYFKMLGIFTIIYLGLVALMIVALLIYAAVKS